MLLFYDPPEEEEYGSRGGRGGRGGYRGRVTEPPHFFRSVPKKDGTILAGYYFPSIDTLDLMKLPATQKTDKDKEKEKEQEKEVKPLPKEDPFGGLKPREATKYEQHKPESEAKEVVAAPPREEAVPSERFVMRQPQYPKATTETYQARNVEEEQEGYPRRAMGPAARYGRRTGAMEYRPRENSGYPYGSGRARGRGGYHYQQQEYGQEEDAYEAGLNEGYVSF